MKSLYNNLLKRGFTFVQEEEARVIDTNAIVARRLEALSARENHRREKDGNAPSAGGDGFTAGLGAQVLPGPAEGEAPGNVIKAGEDAEQIREQAGREAEALLEEARREAEEIRREAEALAAGERERILEQARTEGYAAGQEKAAQEAEAQRRKLEQIKAELEQAYEKHLEALEPELVDAITGVYEHIFRVELGSYRDVLEYLIGSTIRSTEGSHNFLVHVSKEDYPYVSMQRKQILAEAASPGSTVEFVEDLTLHKNECLIETEGGIFDCGLGTELEELGKKLRLLSYEKQVKDH